MRDCRDVIMLAKPGYIYVVRNGGKNGSGKTGGGKKEAGRKWREESGGKKVAGRKNFLIYYFSDFFDILFVFLRI